MRPLNSENYFSVVAHPSLRLSLTVCKKAPVEIIKYHFVLLEMFLSIILGHFLWDLDNLRKEIIEGK